MSDTSTVTSHSLKGVLSSDSQRWAGWVIGVILTGACLVPSGWGPMLSDGKDNWVLFLAAERSVPPCRSSSPLFSRTNLLSKALPDAERSGFKKPVSVKGTVGNLTGPACKVLTPVTTSKQGCLDDVTPKLPVLGFISWTGEGVPQAPCLPMLAQHIPATCKVPEWFRKGITCYIVLFLPDHWI